MRHRSKRCSASGCSARSPQTDIDNQLAGRAIDLAAQYEMPNGPCGWRTVEDSAGRLPIDPAAAGKHFGYFRIESGSRQPALLIADGPEEIAVWQNGSDVSAAEPATGKPRQFLLDLQPGGNDILLKFSGNSAAPGLSLQLRARSPATLTLPEKLDSAELSRRLSAAASGRGQVAAELLTVDWPAAVSRGRVDAGRRLFGSLGCVKCHAIAADQQARGGPSLHQAAKRLTVPHLVESILLPSKQVAEPFRATRIVTSDGLVLSGLVTAESAERIELLQPDATRRTIPTAEIDQRRFRAVADARGPGQIDRRAGRSARLPAQRSAATALIKKGLLSPS